MISPVTSVSLVVVVMPFVPAVVVMPFAPVPVDAPVIAATVAVVLLCCDWINIDGTKNLV